MASVATIARNLGGERGGANWRCPCPLGCGYSLSLAEGEDGRLLAYCFGGHDYHEIEAALVEFGLCDADDFGALRDGADGQGSPDRADEARRIAFSQYLYENAGLDPRIQTYLNSRDIAIWSSVLRFSPRFRHHFGFELPAMLAPVVNIVGEQTGLHATFLKVDGSGQAFAKPGKGEPDLRRQCNGVIRGGAIRLAAHDPDRELALSEGIENGLSAMELFGLPAWSALYAGGLKTVELPPKIRRILLVADNDENGCSQRNAVEGARRWSAEGRKARIWMPETVGDDANDFLIKKRRA
jgi:hypothetical protein